MYLIIAKYTDDAERKRIEYAFERWKASMEIEKPDGIVVVVDGEGIERMLDDLYARTTKENVRVYNLSESSFEVERDERQIKVDLEEEKETIEKFIGFILAKQKALFKREIPFGKLYEVYSKKGKAEISTSLKPENGKVAVVIKIKGYGEAAELVYNKINDELKYFEGV